MSYQPLLRTAAAAALAAVLLAAPAGAAEYLVDRTVAIAGDEAILFSDLNAEIVKYKQFLKSKNAEMPPDDILRKNVLDQLITRRLVLQLAAKNNIEISDTDLDRAITQIAERAGTTPEKLMDGYRATGLSDAAIRNSIREDIIIDEIRQSQVRNRIRISDEEVNQLADVLKQQAAHMLTYHLAVINFVLPVSPTPAQTDAANRKVSQLMRELHAGLPFADAARKYSETGNAVDGGDIGKLTINEIPPFAAAAVSRASAGDVLGPVKTDRGLTVIKVYEIEKLKPEPIEQVKVRHILLTTNVIFDDEAAESRLKTLRNEIINGGRKFDETARMYSNDPGTSYNGGLMDWMNPEVFDPRFRDAVAKLQPGEISEPFRSGFGWHIAELIDRKVDTDSIEAYKIKAREIISNRSLMEESEKWERELRDSSYIKILN